MVDEYDSEMAERGKLDGNMVDSGTMALLNSGINFSLTIRSLRTATRIMLS